VRINVPDTHYNYDMWKSGNEEEHRIKDKDSLPLLREAVSLIWNIGRAGIPWEKKRQ